MERYTILETAFSRRQFLFDSGHTTAFRLFNYQNDGIENLTIDYYDRWLLVQEFADDVLSDSAVNDIGDVCGTLGLEIRGIYGKYRGKVSQRDVASTRISTLLAGEPVPHDHLVKQNGITVKVDLVSGQSTGLFLDMREFREQLVPYYEKEMLNLFCYTGIFSVHGLQNGARFAVNVDLSKTVLSRAEENYRLNNLPVDQRDFIFGDTIEWLKRFSRQGRRFGMVICDPPTFSRKGKKTFSVKKDYPRLISLLDDVSSRYVVTAVNTYGVTKDEYISYHPSHWKQILTGTESADFNPGDNPYLKVSLWEK
jgi:23S rRNA (cytosine1962-C5)-methyltransferase